MSKYYSENPEYSQISPVDKLTRDKIEAILKTFTREMENFSYYGSNPGISENDYDEVAETLMDEFKLWEKAE